MASGGIGLLRCTGEFLRAMRDGLAGRSSSLLMIPTYLSGGTAVPRGESVIVMDAGGTNFRIAAVHFDDLGAPVVEGFQKFPMPGTQGALSCGAFFDALAGYILEYQDISDRVGFCFSFPTEILPNRDGRILAFSKGSHGAGRGGTFDRRGRERGARRARRGAEAVYRAQRHRGHAAVRHRLPGKNSTAAPSASSWAPARTRATSNRRRKSASWKAARAAWS